MEQFEISALSSCDHKPRLWKRYVDDTFVIIDKEHEDDLFNHINSLDPHIQFTREPAKENGAMPFLDTVITPDTDGNLKVSVYRKSTHTDQYLHWDSNHHLSAKYSVVRTLTHRASVVCSDESSLKQELDHIQKVLNNCGYPNWIINKVKNEVLNKNTDEPSVPAPTITKRKPTHAHVVVPYVEGTSEAYRNTMEKHGIKVYFKGHNTIKNNLVSPKDFANKEKKSGLIYRIRCNSCSDSYVGETGRMFQDRLKDHRRAPSPVHLHSTNTGHPPPSLDNIDILAREAHSKKRLIKESMYIRVNNPVLNRNIGKYELPHIYDKLLKSCKDLNFQ